MSPHPVIAALQAKANPDKAAFVARYFKTGPGEYGEHDVFLGLAVGEVRAVARQFRQLSLDEVIALLQSPFHEARASALFIWVDQFKKAPFDKRLDIFEAYLANKDYVNNWDLVDVSARDIVGAFLYDQDRSMLYDFIRSEHLWTVRIALIATAYFIKRKEYTDTLALAELVLNHKHDLIHKASGWMLREVGEQDKGTLLEFLNEHATKMPRTMLRYAIEKLPETERLYYLRLK
ncbi:DNA alkylation repair protein [Siphonobacter aquaeclarae]|jgi:3-methyladenine DNA glycosylase AlkD|uniref:3-methyladenine DNA glycosylase AlkD n=1 Tax=Siphonobacter aquaeclarae TaxID=563176 RepID=A0A1G9WVC6_9BACT|nr:DNA alkylation repair protein [Siphonobacter aquaeclarae]SDM88574.1 3-methyladenine DNA glycosylase AlkD [Siphonobacter aquaeclarae]